MTDNRFSYVKAGVFQQTMTDHGVRHVWIPPRRPQVNGKVERFNRPLPEEWAYADCSPATKMTVEPSSHG